jgi:hypothetical protein
MPIDRQSLRFGASDKTQLNGQDCPDGNSALGDDSGGSGIK